MKILILILILICFMLYCIRNISWVYVVVNFNKPEVQKQLVLLFPDPKDDTKTTITLKRYLIGGAEHFIFTFCFILSFIYIINT